jgi:2-polyprenyl-6-methoxyphenol hydroxylase-like FAD-dependent oxidoreductase
VFQEAALQGTGELGERILAGRRVEPIRATTDLPNTIRESCGPGWALAGDAGLVMDPITGQGMGNALRDADLLTSAVISALDGRTGPEASLKDYVRTRDRDTKAMYDFTVGLASLPASRPAERALFAAIAERPVEVTRFLGVLSGALPVRRLFSPPHLVRLVGLRGFAQLASTRPRPPRTRATRAVNGDAGVD